MHSFLMRVFCPEAPPDARGFFWRAHYRYYHSITPRWRVLARLRLRIASRVIPERAVKL